MAQSPEYPDLKWMPPRSWDNSNRTSVQLVVIHTTEGSATANSAEDGASYDQDRTDGTSTHYFHDNDSTIQCVHTADQAHAARTQGNRRGIQHELCTRAGSANWGDAYHQAMLHRAAKQAARDAKKWGIPIKKLNSSQVASGAKGFCGHVDITYAFPQDNGTHTDPGQNFPWSQFLAMVQDEGDDVSEQDVTNALTAFFARGSQATPYADEVTSRIGRDAFDQGIPNGRGGKDAAYQVLADINGRTVVQDQKFDALSAQVTALEDKLDQVLAALAPPPGP